MFSCFKIKAVSFCLIFNSSVLLSSFFTQAFKIAFSYKFHAAIKTIS